MSYRLKTILGVALIETILLMILVMSSHQAMKNSTESELLQHATTTTRMFATSTKDAVLSYDLASLKSAIDELLANRGVVYARVVDDSGQVLAEGGALDLVNLPFEANASVKEVTDNVLDAQSWVSEGGTRFGQVQVGFDVSSIDGVVSRALNHAISIALLELLLVALFSWFLGVFLTRQLKQLVAAARSVACGDYGAQIPVKGRDEIAQLATAFNSMVVALEVTDGARHQSQTALEQLNHELEDRVNRRTAQLQASHDKLVDINRQLKSAQKQLVQSEKMASIGQLAAGVAHEINNPVGFVASNLNTLKTYSDVYQDFVKSSLELCNRLIRSDRVSLDDSLRDQANALLQLAGKEDIEFINADVGQLVRESLEGAHRVTEIVAGLKTFSRQAIDERKPADINQAIRNTLKLANNEIKYKCEVETELSNLPDVTCNIGQINQVILNLVVNAVHAVEQGGHILVRSGFDMEEVWFSVSDNGCGIDDANLNRLFDPFFTTKPVGQGTGLGLSLSHGIIVEHGGRIDISSEKGKGSIFTVSLPLDHCAAVRSAEALLSEAG